MDRTTTCCGVSRELRPGSTDGLAQKAVCESAAGKAEGVIWLPGGPSFIGTKEPVIGQDGEAPMRPVTLVAFGLEAATVTNKRFAAFVDATGYKTDAERLGWSPVFFADQEHLRAESRTGSQLPWWHRVEGVSWREPEGQGSSVLERMDHPVVQVSWRDANAFAQWVGGRLPTEGEWEYAARGGTTARRFPWGDEEPDDDTAIHCNIWQGRFPDQNTQKDGYVRTAPARSFAPNTLGFFNMSGNVWEWTRDPYRIRSVSRVAKQRNAQALANTEKVLKGGSFLCHASYCYRYRIVARMGMSPDSAGSNTGFRVAYDKAPGSPP